VKDDRQTREDRLMREISQAVLSWTHDGAWAWHSIERVRKLIEAFDAEERSKT
jgi:hypothetical protein